MSKYLIRTNSIEHFDEAFTKLRSVGFVYADRRLKTLKEIHECYPYYPIIIISKDDRTGCKMILHGCAIDYYGDVQMSVDDFLKKIFPTW